MIAPDSVIADWGRKARGAVRRVIAPDSPVGSALGMRPSMPSLPASARKPSQYPTGVPTGVGGGNASGSKLAPAPPPPPRQVARVAPVFQVPPPPPPGQGNVARPVTGRGGRERAYTAMVQQAGLTPEQTTAAIERGEAALAQRKLGPLAGGVLSGKLDPSQHEYWEQADIKAWAAVPAHAAMVKRLKDRHGYTSPEEQFKVIAADAGRAYEDMKPMVEQAYTQGAGGFMPNAQLKHDFDPGTIDVDPTVFQEPPNPMNEILNRHLGRAREAVPMQTPVNENGMTPEDLENIAKRSWTMNWRVQ